MLIGAIGQYFFGIAIFVSSIFLVMLVLVQRGRGGGLTGALGGPGGQSAFGTKAGDLFTRITIGVAVVWILLCASSVILLKSRGIPTLGAGTSNTPGASGTIEGLGDSAAIDLGDPSNTLNDAGAVDPGSSAETSLGEATAPDTSGEEPGTSGDENETPAEPTSSSSDENGETEAAGNQPQEDTPSDGADDR